MGSVTESMMRHSDVKDVKPRLELQLEAERIVEGMRQRLSRLCSSVESRIMEGNPADELLRQAEVGEYDLAVVGATGASDLKHTMLGSVSFKLASNAPCSVAVIR